MKFLDPYPWQKLDREDPEVSRILAALHDRTYTDEILETTTKRVFGLMANYCSLQLKSNGPVIKPAEDAIRTNKMDAAVVTTAISWSVPTRQNYNGALRLVNTCCTHKVPCFLVRDSSSPQRVSERSELWRDLGAAPLQDAFSGELDRVVLIIHGALNASTNTDAVIAAVNFYYEQTQYPPAGWELQPARMVRVP